MSLFAKIRRICNRIAHPAVGEVWCLHRVVPNRSWALPNRELEITPDYLEQLIQTYLREGYRFVSIDEVRQQIHGYRLPWQKKVVNVSFDDGFKDVYQYAYPIFKKYAIPFTIYLTTDFPEGKVYLWWIELEQRIERQSSVVVEGVTYACATPEEKVQTYDALLQRIYQYPETPVQVYRKWFGGACVLDVAEWTLSWEELHEMLSSGLLTIGSHTVTHPMLNKLTAEEVERELKDSQQIIRDRLGVDVVHMSYPHSAYDGDVTRMAMLAGYRSATLGYGGEIHKNHTPYLLPRKYVVQN